MESESINNETLQQMLEQMKQLNENFTEFTQYIEERDKKADAKEQQQEAEKKALSEQQQKDTSLQQESVDSYLAKLTDIHTALTDFEKDYQTTSTATRGSVENIEYNTNFDFIFSAVTVGLLALVIGVLIGRTFFRKL